MIGRKRIRIEIVVDLDPVKVGNPNELLRNQVMSRPLTAMSAAAWELGSLISRHVHDYDEWAKAEIASGDADDARGYRRAEVNLVEPAHHEIDLLEPRPPRKQGDHDLTPAGRLAWYREHLPSEQGWRIGERVCRLENVFAADSPMLKGTVTRRYAEPGNPELYEVTWRTRGGEAIEPLVCLGFRRHDLIPAARLAS